MTSVVDSILTALQDQVHCYGRLAKLAEIQHEHVQNNHTDELLNVLTQRQQVLDQVADLEQILGPTKRRWNDYVRDLNPSDRALAEEMLADTRRLLEQINTADRNDALVLQQRKLNIGKQINTASAARQINRTYAAAAYGRPASRMDVSR